jgi:hypothetical protein
MFSNCIFVIVIVVHIYRTIWKKTWNNIYHETIICFVLRKINAFQLCCYYRKKKQTAYCNPFRSVQTRLNLSKHVSIRSDLLKPVETRFNPFRSVETRFKVSPPSPPSPSYPLLPLFPFLFFGGGVGVGVGGGGWVGGKPPPPKPPGRGGGDEVPPPPPQDFKQQQQQKTKFSHTLSSLCCVIYPSYPPKGFSLSVHCCCCCCSKLHKHLWRRPLNKIHCGILQYLYLYIFIIYPPSINI